MNKTLLVLAFSLVIPVLLPAQDLMDMLKDDKPSTEYAYATFKTSRIVLGQSIENTAKNNLQFLVQHNFGRINEGAYNWFGLDRSTVRLCVEYGITDRLSASLARSSYGKTVDASLKYKLLRQSKGAKNMPITLSLYSDLAVNGLKWTDNSRKNYFSSRLSFVNQVLVARKFSNSLSLQLTPTMVHKNLVATRAEQNDLYLLGAGGRLKLTQRTSVNAEYYQILAGNPTDAYTSCLSLGLDVETGGHVFQFRLSNAQPMFDEGFLGENTGKWSKADIYFGFTINRMFSFKK